MLLRIVGARSAEQFDIIEGKIPFDLNILSLKKQGLWMRYVYIQPCFGLPI